MLVFLSANLHISVNHAPILIFVIDITPVRQFIQSRAVGNIPEHNSAVTRFEVSYFTVHAECSTLLKSGPIHQKQMYACMYCMHSYMHQTRVRLIRLIIFTLNHCLTWLHVFLCVFWVK